MKKTKKYQEQIGDGKLPNKYWVFQYDQKYKRVKDEDGTTHLEVVEEDNEAKDSLLGEFKTYQEALQCVDNKAYLPNIVIEDRLSGVIFEQMCIVCPCCDREDWDTIDDSVFTRKQLGDKFK